MDEQTTPPPAPPAPAPTQKQTSALAVASLVSGLLGWTLVPWLGSLAAIITGHMARAEIRRNPDTIEGDGLAITGLVLGWSSFVLGLLAFLFVLALIVFVFGSVAALLAGLGLSGHLN